MSSSDRVAQLYPQAQNFLFLAFYDSQGYDGGVLNRLHTGNCPIKKSYMQSHFVTDDYHLLLSGNSAVCPTALNPAVNKKGALYFQQKSVPGTFLEVEDGRRVRLTSPPSVSGLSRENVGASTSHNPMGLHGLLQG
jgi:hypothetical protein